MPSELLELDSDDFALLVVVFPLGFPTILSVNAERTTLGRT